MPCTQAETQALKRCWRKLFKNYEAWRHIHFRHVVDPSGQSIASQFTAEVVEHDGTMMLTNCNFFYLRDGKSQQVFVYMSDGVNVLN
jgi:hypothetical protein